jgi:hypothetical protein
MYSPPGSQDAPVYFITEAPFWTPGSHLTDFKEHKPIFKGFVIIKIDCRLL